MDIRYSAKRILLEREKNDLDEFVLEFTSVLNRLKVRYVVVSGYVSILFGRSRSSEDVDLIIERADADAFKRLWNSASREFECLNTGDCDEAYTEYLCHDMAIRFARVGKAIPNMEIHFPKDELDRWTLANRKEVLFNGHRLFISPLELQIPFKLHLGSEKDIEDARHLYRMFKVKLNEKMLSSFSKKLKVEAAFRTYLR